MMLNADVSSTPGSPSCIVISDDSDDEPWDNSIPPLTDESELDDEIIDVINGYNKDVHFDGCNDPIVNNSSHHLDQNSVPQQQTKISGYFCFKCEKAFPTRKKLKKHKKIKHCNSRPANSDPTLVDNHMYPDDDVIEMPPSKEIHIDAEEYVHGDPQTSQTENIVTSQCELSKDDRLEWCVSYPPEDLQSNNKTGKHELKVILKVRRPTNHERTSKEGRQSLDNEPESSDSEHLQSSNQTLKNVQDIILNKQNQCTEYEKEVTSKGSKQTSESYNVSVTYEENVVIGTQTEISDLFTCDICNKTFQSSVLHRRHMYYHAEKARGPFTCNVCGKTFPHKPSLEVHSRMHTGQKPYGCQLCGKYYYDASALRYHMRYHTGETPYVCPICHKGFKDTSKRTRHMSQVHHGEKIDDSESVIPRPEFRCYLCGKSFKENGSLKAHMKSLVHCNERSHKCVVCNKGFTLRSHMKRHMKMHETHDGAPRDYGCSFCEKTFKYATSLKIHTRSHTGETPYSCNDCGEQFTCNSTMWQHIKRHHPGMDPDCSDLIIID